MSVKKIVKEELEKQEITSRQIFEYLANRVINTVTAFGDKLDETNKVTFSKRIVSCRNWISFLLLWLILFVLLSSCFVSGRQFHVITPRVDVSADTATAYSWPYNSKFQ